MKVLIKNHTGLSGYQRRLKKESLFLLNHFNLSNAELSILLVSDSEMERLNSTFRGKKKTTDVLSFPIYNSLKETPSKGEVLIGDIVINLKAAMRQAQQFGISDYEEIRRLLIHGFLHLLGYDHERNRYQEMKMKKKEKELYNAFKEMD
ncbi:MAG: rRNA maturation RNase YbeY [Thermodesulfovibrionales bacterium]